MTGEITLRGRVLPIGGLKLKVLAATRVGIDKVVLPEKNRKDFEEIPKTIRDKVKCIFIKNMDEVVPHIFAFPKKRNAENLGRRTLEDPAPVTQ